MERKVYLVTRRASYNFGSSLQAYALQTLLTQACGHCEILDVKEMRLRGRLRLAVLDVAGLVLQMLPLLRRWVGAACYDRLVQSRRARRRFDAFNDGVLRVSPRRLHSERRLRRYVEEGSLIVCGSDQIWNPLGFSPVMFLSFADPSRHTLAAYAPSFGLGEVTLHREEIARLVRRFHHLSAREASGRVTLEQMTGRRVPLVLDPTLVVAPSVWFALEQAVDVPKGGYVLCYFLSTSLYPLDFIADLAMRHGLTVVNIRTNYSPFALPGAVNRADCGPREFLYLVRRAVAPPMCAPTLSIAASSPTCSAATSTCSTASPPAIRPTRTRASKRSSASLASAIAGWTWRGSPSGRLPRRKRRSRSFARKA